MRRVVDPRFGRRMRELRGRMPYRDLAKITNYSHTYLWEIETGRKPPNADVAAKVDAALGAAGELAGMVVEQATALTPDDSDRLSAVARRPRTVDPAALGSLAVILGEQRRLEDSIGSTPLIRPVAAQLVVVKDLVVGAPDAIRRPVLDLAAEWAQFAGWLHMSAEQTVQARRWLDAALEWATEAGNADMVATVLSFQGHLAWLSGQVQPTIELSRAARQDPTVYVGQLAYDAMQEARGLAVTGAKKLVKNALGEALDLADRTAAHTGPVPAWHYYRIPGFFTMERGLVYRLLGRDERAYNQQAVELLRRGVDDLPEEMRGSEWSADYLVQLALAYEQDGDTASAEDVVERVRRVAERTNSVRLNLRASGLTRRLAVSNGHC